MLPRLFLGVAFLGLGCCSMPDLSSITGAPSTSSSPHPVGSPAKSLTALEVCRRLVGVNVAANCRAGTPGGLGSAAREEADFDLPSVPGKGGQVLLFDQDNFYQSTVDAFGRMATLAGRHQYGNPKARIFVQLTATTPQDVGDRAKSMVASF